MIIKKLKPCPHDEGAYKAVDLKIFLNFSHILLNVWMIEEDHFLLFLHVKFDFMPDFVVEARIRCPHNCNIDV